MRDEAALASSLRDAATELTRNPDELLLIGIEPEEADPELGYIMPTMPAQPAAASSSLRAVASFVDKPEPSVARALVTEPDLILADEPTGNLDSHSGAEVMAILGDLHRSGRTVVLITHDADVATTADRQIHLRDGRIAA